MADHVDHALRDARIVELRHLGSRVASGLFDDGHALRHAIRTLGGSGNLYTTLNAPADVTVTNAMTAKALTDDDIAVIVRLPFDFDPVRGADTPSTDAELAEAIKVRNRFVNALQALNWPRPAVALSGNGAHALYRCRVPASKDAREMLGHLYAGMKRDFSTESVQFDSTVRNPSRIWRAYGTTNRKGIATADRPHRVAHVALPPRWEGVSLKQIESLANSYARQRQQQPKPIGAATIPAGTAGDFTTLDMVAWMQARGLYRRPLGMGKHAVICPWNGEHSVHHPDDRDSSTVIWERGDGGWPTWHCSHLHCEGRTIIDVMQQLGDASRYCAQPYRRTA